MATTAPFDVDIPDILARRAIEVYFQPIVSVRKRTIVGVEALSRGMDRSSRIIPPDALSRRAAAEGLTLQLDQLCRATAIKQFVPLQHANPELILFVNLHGSTVHQDAAEPNELLRLLQQQQLDPRNIAFEILESAFTELARLRAAVKAYNDSGFLVVLDDVGVSYSNLDRILDVSRTS